MVWMTGLAVWARDETKEDVPRLLADADIVKRPSALEVAAELTP